MRRAQELRPDGDGWSRLVEAPMSPSYPDHQFEEPVPGVEPTKLSRILARNGVRIITIMLLALAVGAASIWLAEPVYSARATIQIGPQPSLITGDEILADDAERAEDARALQRQVDLLVRRSTTQNVADKLNLANNPQFLREVGLHDEPAGLLRNAKVISALEDRLLVSSPSKTSIVAVHFDSRDPVVAARTANAFAATFVSDSFKRQSFTYNYARRFRRGQLELATQRLEQAERNLLAYIRSAGSAGGDTLPLREARLMDLNEAYSKAQANQIEAQERLQQASAASGMSNAISIVDLAEPPAHPTYPRPAMNLALAFLAGALVLGGDYARTRMTKKEDGAGDLEREFDAPLDVPVPPGTDIAAGSSGHRLYAPSHAEGDVERVVERDVKRVAEPVVERDLERDAGRYFHARVFGVIQLSKDSADLSHAQLDPSSRCGEAHHAIFLALDRIARTADQRVLLLTSSCPDEAKSVVAIKLSANFAAAGKKVLLMDADLRSGSLHRMLDLSNRPGLADLLGKNSTNELTEVAQHRADWGFSVVSSGEPATNPSELLASMSFADLLDQAVNLYDLVILDGPPVLGLPDAPLLSGIADATVLVLKADQTRWERAKRAMGQLSKAGAGQIGLVVSKYSSAKDFVALEYAHGETP